MMLQELLTGIAPVDRDVCLTGLSLDSRSIKTGNAFIALAGFKEHGIRYAEQAIKSGARVILFEPTAEAKAAVAELTAIPCLEIPNLSLLLGEIAARFYGRPSEHLAVIGITGTNGKTSCSQFLSQVLSNCGVIGTLGWGEWGNLRETVNTTPDALAVQAMLAQLRAHGKQAVAMEVSSHGLAQGRVNSVKFAGAVFTNISRDHLDYHGTMAEYLQAKLKLLAAPGLKFAVINLDDAYSDQILAAVPNGVEIWGVTARDATAPVAYLLKAERISHEVGGISFEITWQNQSQKFELPLYGDFNIENGLLVLAVMLAMGEPLSEAATKLARLVPVSGRMERLGGIGEPLIFVDYAHTPDALHKVLASVRKHCKGALWVVFGCGGNRDRGKRPEMGSCAEQLADQVIVTDDNPRFENATDIVNDILAGCSLNKVKVIFNRNQAIQHVVTQARPNDCIVIAGKGHEEYQEINGVKVPFSDRAAVITALTMRTKNCDYVVE